MYYRHSTALLSATIDKVNGLPYTLMLLIAVPILTAVFYFVDFSLPVDKIFLSISTFIFSIFTGFFISRQAGRFNRVRETVTQFDGILSSVYRMSSHVSRELQMQVGRVVSAHYEKILETKQWNIHFVEKSTTLTDLHTLLDTYVKEDEVTKLGNQALGAITKGLATAQNVRKRMVALYEERIPPEQWMLIIFFIAILILTVSVIPSQYFLFASLLKAAFVISVLSVVYILHKLNNLAYSEKIMGQHSAEDVLGIIDGTK